MEAVWDFRRLNFVMEAVVYLMPNMSNLSDRLASCRVFIKIDSAKDTDRFP